MCLPALWPCACSWQWFVSCFAKCFSAIWCCVGTAKKWWNGRKTRVLGSHFRANWPLWIYRDLDVLNKMLDILSCVSRLVAVRADGCEHVRARRRAPRQGWRERADGGEGEVRVRKRWHHWENAELDSRDAGMKEAFSHSRPALPRLPPSLPPLARSFEMYSVGRVLVPTRLVNGRGVEYFKLHFPPFPPLLLLSSLPFHFFPPCLVVH